MFVKIHESYRKVVAVCDSEIIGKKFEEGKRQLDVKESFYRGAKFDSELVKKIMIENKANDATFNIVGEKSVKIALESGIITRGNIGKVGGIPFALVLL
jgi:uncharacterized protein